MSAFARGCLVVLLWGSLTAVLAWAPMDPLPYWDDSWLEGEDAATGRIAPDVSSLYLMYTPEGSRGPIFRSFPAWKTADGADAREAIEGLMSWRAASRMHPGMENAEPGGLVAVMNALEFRPRRDQPGEMEAVFYGEFHGVKLPLSTADVSRLNAGQAVVMRFSSTVDRVLYIVHSTVTMTVRLQGPELSIVDTTAAVDLVRQPVTAVVGLSAPERYHSAVVEIPKVVGRLSLDPRTNAAIRRLELLN